MTHSLRAKLGIFLERKKNVDRKSVREFSFCLVICRTHHAKDAQYMLHVALQALTQQKNIFSCKNTQKVADY